MDYLVWLKEIISYFSNQNSHTHTRIPVIYGIDILAKWTIHVEKTNIISNMKENGVLNASQQIVVYSINTDNLVGEFSKIIELLLIDYTEEDLIKHNINKIMIQDDIFLINNFEIYDVDIADKKYIIKKYNLNELSRFQQEFPHHI